MDRDDPAYAGQRDYGRVLLALYDPLVLGPILRFVWRCPSQVPIDTYRRAIRSPHLDVGPGTGYFIAHSGLPAGSAVTLLDPNATVLAHAARRLAGLRVQTVQADVLKPLPVSGPYASAALSAVLHCLPGPAERKALAVRNIAAVLAPDGVLFGASVLGTTGNHNWLARRFLAAFNRRGAFDNLADSQASLRAMLEEWFDSVDLSVVGSVAIFQATGPRPAAAP